MSNFIADMAESVAAGLGSIFKTSMPSYCDIETADTDTSLVTRKGALISGIRLEGMRSAIGPEEFEATVETLTRALQSYLMNAGHSVDVFASRDAAGVRGPLGEMASGVRKTCEAIGLEMTDVINANEAELAKHTADEAVYIGLWTRQSMLTKREVEGGHKEMGEASRSLPRAGWSSQNLITTLSALRERHEATVRSVFEDLRGAGIMCELLSAHEMLRVARMQIDPGFTPPGWKPHLIGDKVPVVGTPAILRDEDATQLEFSDLQFPPVSWQMFPRDAQRVNAKYVVVGERAYAPVFIEIPPREVMPFSALFEKLSSAQVPWRAMFRIDGGGLKYMGTKDALAQMLAITSQFNRRVAESIKSLRRDEFGGNTLVRFRMSFCTWAPANNMNLLAQRASRLAQTISAWGQAEVREVSGDAMLGLVSTVPFFTEECAANAAVAPLAHIVRMLPIMRPASPWKSGSIVFRTMDGRLMPFQPGSSLQTTWNYILFGRPGKGKSVQMLNLILGTCMQPGLSRLPRVGIVDIGASSQYFTTMLRDSLPKNMRHLVAGFKLTMSPEHAINPFDLPLGCRYPTAEHKAFIVNILTQIATPAEASGPYSRISELVSKVVDDIYAKLSGETASSTPKRYSPGDESAVDELLKSYGFGNAKEAADWWHVVDFLASKGHTHEATLAQRYAVPIIPDCTAIPQQVIDIYGKIKVESGETLPEAFSSLLSSATRDFPNLATPTRFDIGEVRVAAINLEEVAKTGSDAADRQAAVMYLLASYALTKDYRYNEDTVKSMRMPAQYVDYHMTRARETKEDLKWIAYDEFHRTAKSPAVQDSVLIDMREGRKYNIGVILSSQGAGDFPAVMREFATGTFIVDAGSQKNAEELQKHFGFNDTARKLLTTYVNGPKSSGAPLLAIIDTKGGIFTQLLVSTLGLETRWALSTTTEDVLVREAVCKRLGAANGRLALAASYPDGAKGAVEQLREEGRADAVNEVAQDVLKFWEKRKAA
jgi:intracellular multiplication protein IcmB